MIVAIERRSGRREKKKIFEQWPRAMEIPDELLFELSIGPAADHGDLLLREKRRKRARHDGFEIRFGRRQGPVEVENDKIFVFES